MYTLEQAFKDIQIILTRTINQTDYTTIQTWFRIYDNEYIEETISKMKTKRLYSLNYIVKVLQSNIFDYEERKKAIEATKKQESTTPPSSSNIPSFQNEKEQQEYVEFLKWKEMKRNNQPKESYINPLEALDLLEQIDPEEREANLERVKKLDRENKLNGYMQESDIPKH